MKLFIEKMVYVERERERERGAQEWKERERRGVL
jgi:hypothetical protein